MIDKQEGDHFVGDIAEVLGQHAQVDVIVNNALPLMRGIDECSYEEFQYALSVGVTAPFYPPCANNNVKIRIGAPCGVLLSLMLQW